MNWRKVFMKGLEGAIVAGGATGAVTQDVMVSVTTAGIGFLFRAARNWWKHK